MLTIGYLDEDGELVTETGVDSDDDIQGDGESDNDAQEWCVLVLVMHAPHLMMCVL